LAATTECGETLCAKEPSGPDVAPLSRVGDQALLTPPPSPTSSLSRRRKAKQASDLPELTAGCQSASCPDEITCKDSRKRNVVVQRLCAFLEPESGGSRVTFSSLGCVLNVLQMLLVVLRFLQHFSDELLLALPPCSLGPAHGSQSIKTLL
jgi:hypothetical protein